MKMIPATINLTRKQIIRVIEYLVNNDYPTGHWLLATLNAIQFDRPGLRLLHMMWMDRATQHKVMTFRQSIDSLSFGPRIFGKNQTVEKITLPEINLYKFNNAFVSPSSSSVISNNLKLFLEKAQSISDEDGNYSTFPVKSHRTKTAVVQMNHKTNVDQGIFLAGNGSFNYYHWLIEILPRLQYINELPIEYKHFPLLVSAEVERVKSFRESLAIYAGDREVVSIEPNSHCQVANLLYITSPNNLPFNLRNGIVSRPSHTIIRKESIDFLRNALSNSLPNAAPRTRVFFARKGELRTYNQDAVWEVLKGFGFSKVFMEDLSFQEQVSLVNSAEWIAGPTGAAWANLVFCRKGTKCLCWMAKESGDFSGYSNIAQHVGADLHYITYTLGESSAEAQYTKEYFIDPDVVDRTLRELMS